MGNIYFSYHLDDSDAVLSLRADLALMGYPIAIDSLMTNLGTIIDDTCYHFDENTDIAIVVWSNAYDTSRYCQDEFAELVRTKKRMIVLQSTATVPQKYLESIAQVIQFHSQSTTNEAYQHALNTLKTSLGQSTQDVTEEYSYLINLLQQVEAKLYKQPTALAVKNHDNFDHRPFLYKSSIWLTEGDYEVEVVADSSGQTSNIGVQNVKDWLRINPQLLVYGDVDTGKTSLLLHITRYITHQRLQNGNAVSLPISVDLQKWETGSFDAFIQAIIAQSFQEQPSQVMYIIDDIRADLLTYKQLVEIHAWMSQNKDIEAVIATDLQVAEQFDWRFPYLRLNALSEQQSASLLSLVPKSISPEQITADQMSSLATLTDAMLVKSILDDVSVIDKQIYPYSIDAYIALDEAYTRKATSEQLKAGLQKLALHTVEKATPFAMLRESALECVGDDMLLQQAVVIGLLETFRDKIAFTSDNLRQFLAAEAIYLDGVYAHMQRPQLQSDGTLKLSPKERFIRDLPAQLHDINLVGILETTAEINPYLALDFYTHWQTSNPSLFRTILQKLFMLPDTLWSLEACSHVTQAQINQYPSQIADALLVLLDNDDPRLHKRIYNLINHAWSVPDHIYSILSNIEIDFPDAVLNEIEPSQQSEFLIALLRITQSKHSKYRATVLSLLGTLRVNASITLLQSIIWRESGKARDLALQALTNIDRNKVLQTLFYAIAAATTKTARESLISELEPYGRLLSGRLLVWIHDTDHTDDLIDVIISSSESSILSSVLIYCKNNFAFLNNNQLISPNIRLTASEGENPNMKALLDALSKKMPSLKNQSAFESFLRNVLSYLRQQEDSDSDNEDIEYVKERLLGMSRHRPTDIADDTIKTTLPRKLILSLEHTNWIIRRKAVERLATYPPEQSIELLLKAAQDEDLQVRIAALEGFPLDTPDDRIIEILLDALLVDDFLLAETAANRIQELEDMRVPQLIDLLADAPLNALAVIIDLLGTSGDERAIESLKPYLTDTRKPWLETKTIGDMATAALLEIGTDEARNTVRAVNPTIVEDAPDIILPDMEEIVVVELSNILTELQSDEWQTSQEAAKKLREYAKRRRGEPARSVATYLEQYLDAENWTVRWAVIEALAWLQVPETIALICPRLQDDNWTVSIAAIRTLMELDATQCDTEIAKLLDSDNSTVREAAAEALGVLQSKRTVDLLRPALTDEDDFVRLAAVKSLITVSGKTATELLIAHQDDYHHVRWHIAQYLTAFKSAKLLRVYIKMLADNNKPEWEDQTVRELAEVAISKIDTEEARSILKKWRQIRPNK